DTIIVNDLTGTAVTRIGVNLDGSGGGTVGDGQADTVIVNGTNGADVIPVTGTLIGAGFGVVFVGGNAGAGTLPYFMTITATEGGRDTLLVNGSGGNDVVDASGLFATNATQLIKLTENGGAGNDTLIGSPGADTFLWFPGDGSDTVQGGDGADRIVFDGSDAAEQFAISANGAQARVTHDLDDAAVDVGGVETIVVNPLGGADTVTLNDLTGTAVSGLGLNLGGTLGSAAGDGQADSVIVNGRNAADLIPVRGNNEVIIVDGGAFVGVGGGLPYVTTITAAEGAFDTLTVNALGGDDVVDASALFPTNGTQLIRLTVNGGAGNDALIGSPGDDTFVWNPGDGSDAIDGQGGGDHLAFIGSNDAERFDLSANGTHVRLTRDVDGVAMDLNGVERVDVIPLGGAD